MPKKGKTTRPTGRPIAAGDQGPRDRLTTLMKWAGGITAILSLIFGLRQITQLLADVRERQRDIAELYKIGKQQQGAADYEGAWASFEQAIKTAEQGGQLAKLTGQLGKERLELREAQEDLAMEWLENVRASQGQTFSDIVDKLVPVLSRGLVSSSGPRKADLLAHVGWANFLRWREGNFQLNPEQQYREALEIDSANPYAHANWAHWMLWSREKLEEAKRHFSAALASGRARDYVREIQLAALKNFGEEGEGEFLAVVNDMRKNNEKIDSRTRSNVYSMYYFAFDRGDRLQKLLAAVPATEQLATFRALFYDTDFDESKRLSREAYLATLQEAAGQRAEALRTWLALRSSFSNEVSSRLLAGADAAIKRLSPRR